MLELPEGRHGKRGGRRALKKTSPIPGAVKRSRSSNRPALTAVNKGAHSSIPFVNVRAKNPAFTIIHGAED